MLTAGTVNPETLPRPIASYRDWIDAGTIPRFLRESADDPPNGAPPRRIGLENGRSDQSVDGPFTELCPIQDADHACIRDRESVTVRLERSPEECRHPDPSLKKMSLDAQRKPADRNGQAVSGADLKGGPTRQIDR